MTDKLARLNITAKTGGEPFYAGGKKLDCTLLDFWRWSVSDLMSNATRGRLAEFIVARALGVSTDGVRDEWSAYDLTTPDGLKIEVKASAYIQSWYQRDFSRISFDVPKTLSWDPDTNLQNKEPKRQADVYVFALLAHKKKPTIDALNLDQWRFYVLATATLDARKRSQDSITLKSLETLAGPPIDFAGLATAVRRTPTLFPGRCRSSPPGFVCRGS